MDSLAYVFMRNPREGLNVVGLAKAEFSCVAVLANCEVTVYEKPAQSVPRERASNL